VLASSSEIGTNHVPPGERTHFAMSKRAHSKAKEVNSRHQTLEKDINSRNTICKECTQG